VIRDAFGREQQITRPFYLSSATLAKGLHDYEYAAGSLRSTMSANWDYGRLALSARHRYGFTPFLTAGARVEAHGDLISAGPSMNARLPFGELELSAAASRGAGISGTAVSAGYSYTGRVLMGGFTVRAAQPGYRTLSTKDTDDSPTRDATAFVAVNVGGRANVSVQQSNGQGRRSGSTRRTSLYGTVRVAERASLFFSASRDRVGAERSRLFSMGLTLLVGGRTSLNASVAGDGDAVGAAFEAQRGLPLGTGYAYRLRAASGGGEGSGGRLSYQTAFGRYEVEQERLNGGTSASLSLSGGLVGIGGRLLPTRPVDQGFALVRVPGVRGVRTFLSNQEVGRTDGRGDLLIPNLLPYYANRLRIADEDVPMDRAIEAVERRIAPPLRGGALVVFDAARAGGVAGRIELEVGGSIVVPAFGEMTVTGGAKQLSSPVGRNGEYYLDDLAPGEYEGLVLFRGEACRFSLRVPASPEPVVDLGTTRCAMRGGR
jgi:outer membrane usher protein